jgi:hypothetical protein
LRGQIPPGPERIELARAVFWTASGHLRATTFQGGSESGCWNRDGYQLIRLRVGCHELDVRSDVLDVADNGLYSDSLRCVRGEEYGGSSEGVMRCGGPARGAGWR